MKKILILIFLAAAMPAWGVEQIPLTPMKEKLFNKLSSEYACQCGCGATMKACPHEYCSFAVPFRNELREYVSKDFSTDKIDAIFVAKHGEIIRAMPTFKGFNIMAWITPFAAILIVGTSLYFAIREWVNRSQELRTKTAKLTRPEESDPFTKRMREELTNFED